MSRSGGRPTIKPGVASCSTSFRLPQTLRAAVCGLADAAGVSQSEYIREAVERRVAAELWVMATMDNATMDNDNEGGA